MLGTLLKGDLFLSHKCRCIRSHHCIVMVSQWYTSLSVMGTFWHSPNDATDATDAIDNFLLLVAVEEALSGPD